MPKNSFAILGYQSDLVLETMRIRRDPGVGIQIIGWTVCSSSTINYGDWSSSFSFLIIVCFCPPVDDCFHLLMSQLPGEIIVGGFIKYCNTYFFEDIFIYTYKYVCKAAKSIFIPAISSHCLHLIPNTLPWRVHNLIQTEKIVFEEKLRFCRIGGNNCMRNF